MHNLALRHGMLLLWACFALPPFLAAQQPRPESAAPATEQASCELQLQLLDAPLPALIPQEQRAADLDERIEAYAWYSTGHLLQKRRQFFRAYRAYQQAIRYDPAALAAYDALVQLARPLRRYDDAVRYMIKSVELDPSRYNTLFGLAAQFSRVEDPRYAVQLFEQARQSPDLKKDSMAYVVLMRELGRLYQRQARPDAAADAYQTVADALADPERFDFDRDRLRRTLRTTPEALYTEVGEVYLAAGKAEESLELFQKVRANDPDNTEVSFYLAKAYLKLDRAEKALAELNKHLEQRSRRKTGTAPFELQAEILEKLGRRDELIPTLEQADEHDFARKYFLAEQYRLAKQYDKAEELLIAALLEDPDPQASGYQGLVEIYYETRQAEKLVEHAGRTWLENKNSLNIVRPKLATIAQDQEFVSQLVATTERLLEEKPNDIKVGTIYAAAWIARAAEQVEPATKLYRAALDRRDDPGWYFELGSMQFFAKRYLESAEVFRDGLEKGDGGPVVFQIFLVRSLALGGQIDEALEVAHKGEELAVQQQDLEDQVRLGALAAWVLYYAQRFDEAKEAYQRLIDEHWADWPLGLVEVDQGLPNPIREAHFALSNIYVELGDFARSEELLLRVLGDDPHDPHANNDLGYLWADQDKNLEKAEAMIRKAVEAEPENGAYLDSLGWVLYRREKYEEARKYLEQATEVLKESDPVIWDHLGDVYQKLKLIREAREAWSKAQQLFEEGDRKDPKRVDQILKKLKDTSP